MRFSRSGFFSNRSVSAPVLTCRMCSRVSCRRASSIASFVDFTHASVLRIYGWRVASSGTPRAFSAARLRSIVGVSSQCVITSVRASRKIASSVSGSSTSMLPVDAPMNTLIPQP